MSPSIHEKLRLVAHIYSPSAGEVETGNSRALSANHPSPTDKLQVCLKKQCDAARSSSVEETILWLPCAHIQNPNTSITSWGERPVEKSSTCGRERMSLGSQKGSINSRDTRKDSEASFVTNKFAMSSSREDEKKCMYVSHLLRHASSPPQHVLGLQHPHRALQSGALSELINMTRVSCHVSNTAVTRNEL